MSAGTELAAERALEAFVQKELDIARRLIGAKYAALGVLAPDGSLSHFITSGLDEEIVARIGTLPIGRGLLGALVEETGPLRLKDLTKDPRSVGFPPHHPPMRSFLGVPVLAEGRVLGRLYLTEKVGADEFSQEDEALAAILAVQVAVVVENARLYTSLEAERQQLQELVERLIQTQEEERRRVAYDIHDGLGQMIVAAGMHLEIYRAERKGKEEARLEGEFSKAVRYLDEAIAETRRIVSELRPALLDDFGLAEALRHYAHEMASRVGWQIKFEESLGATRLDKAVETTLFRIAQEALANAQKHAGAKQIAIRLQKEGAELLLEVQDWGVGFEVETAWAKSLAGGHVGLAGMRERAQLLGGRFNIESAPGQGTLVKVSLALREEAKASQAEVVGMTKKEEPAMRLPNKGGITVLIVDDHPMVREGLQAMLQVGGISVVGEATTGAEAVEQVRRLQPDVVLMDVRMPDMDGLTATEIVKSETPSTCVIVVTSYESKDYLRRAILAGAAGYVLKGMSRETLVDAIKVVKGGGSLIEAKLLGELLSELGIEGTRYQEAHSVVEALSPREKQVLQLLVQGLSNKEIASEMHYSLGTVKNVVQRVIEKLGVSDRTQAAVLAVRAGLQLGSVPPP